MADKKDALAKALEQIEKQFGEGAVMKLGDNTHMNVGVIPTGSLSLDLALGIGGVPKGRIVEIYGPESSGKTIVALHIAAEAQRRAVPSPLSMRSTRWIRSMLLPWAWMWITFWFPSPTTASRP